MDDGFDPTDFSQFDAVQQQKMLEQIEYVTNKRNTDGKYTYNANEVRNKINRILAGKFRKGKRGPCF